ncbi:MAG: Sensor protein [Rhodocyclaceae bacterium]|nr:MAG: Sensor protein [Rhodocyclaceae bacterium]
MPTLDGLAATRQIRALPNGRQVPVIAMTANAYAEDRALCLAAGMDDFITKPASPELLFATVLSWLEKADPEGRADSKLSCESS